MVDVAEIVDLLKEADEKIMEKDRVIAEQKAMLDRTSDADIGKEASYSMDSWGSDGMGSVAVGFNSDETPTERMLSFFNN